MADLLATSAFAHRGLHGTSTGCLENTMAAFRLARDHGYGIELDVRRSSDGEAMVFHDAALDRLAADTRPVAEVTAAELSSIRLRDSADRIPTLAEVLDMVGGTVPILIEMKFEAEELVDAAPTMHGLVQRVVEVTRPHQGTVALMSFREAAMRTVAELAPTVTYGFVTVGDDVGVQNASAVASSSFVAWRTEDLPSVQAAKMRRTGRPVFAWTVRSSSEAQRVSEVADAVIFEQFRPDIVP